MTTILRAASREPSVWANGAGVTTEVARSSTEPFDWRVSIATISSDGPFSVLPGIDRILLPLSNQGLELVVNGQSVRLERWQQLRFRGEDAVASVGVVDESFDLNLMTRRGVSVGTLEQFVVNGHRRLNSPVDVSTVLIAVILGGELECEGHTLSPCDAVLASDHPVDLAGAGSIAVTKVHFSTTL